MARLKSINDEDLLRVAREVFLEKGYEVQLVEIAARAGISSGSIFRRFPDKKSLFHEAMKPTEASWLDSVNGFTSQSDLKAALEHIATQIFYTARQTMPCKMLAWAQRFNDFSIGDNREAETLAGFLSGEVELGRLRPSLDTQIAARTIIGAMHHLVMLELFTNSKESNPEQFIKNFIDTLWKGLLANPESY